MLEGKDSAGGQPDYHESSGITPDGDHGATIAAKEPHNLDILSAFPAEIKVQIFEQLEAEDARSLSHSSRSFYTFSWRLRFKSIILGVDSIKLFQEGGLGEHCGQHVRSVSFGKLHKWDEDASELATFLLGESRDPDTTLDELRANIAALSLFPRLQRLSFFYEVPSAAENNAYIATFNELCRNSTLCNNLEYLQIQIVKVPEIDAKDCYTKSDELYRKLYSKLSTANQELLGEKVSNEEVEGFLKARLQIQGFPMLKEAEILVSCIAGPMADSKTAHMKRSQFYYIPLTFAPQLRILHVGTTDSNPVFDTYGFTQDDDSTTPVDLDAALLDTFSKIVHLTLTTYAPPRRQNVQRLVQRFPDLRSLYMKMFNNRACEGYHRNSLPYTAIGELKDLSQLLLPWPRDNRGSFALERLQRFVNGWREAGADRLTEIDFWGRRNLYTTTHCRMWEDISVWFNIDEKDPHESGVRVFGDIRRPKLEDLSYARPVGKCYYSGDSDGSGSSDSLDSDDGY
ncbi:hypothetical protein TWF281_011277 [Arthrobotrys megalospora]